jgi:hypothetical protein
MIPADIGYGLNGMGDKIDESRKSFIEQGREFTQTYLARFTGARKIVAEILGNLEYLGARQALNYFDGN